MKHFVGSKGGSGIAQWIISHMPYHRVYVEGFLGRGVVLKTKAPAQQNFGIERDPKVISRYWRRPTKAGATWHIHSGDFFEFVSVNRFGADTLVYLDPPYLQQSRSCQRRYYRHELLTVEDHKRLLAVALLLPCMVMISGYWSELYAQTLSDWRSDHKATVNRRGKVVQEWLWMNFPEPALLHDSRFVGSDFTDRQRVKRKTERWLKKFVSIPAGERNAIFAALKSAMPPAA